MALPSLRAGGRGSGHGTLRLDIAQVQEFVKRRPARRDNRGMSMARPGFAPHASLLALGFAAAVGQAVLLREAMAALGGSELAWGAVLALWLAGMGLGSWLGARPAGRSAAVVGPVLVLALVALGVVLMRAAPAVSGAGPGEAGTAWRGAWLWAIAVALPAAAGGWCFPAAASALAGAGRAGNAYALEAAGATVGGLAFTFALAESGSAGAVCASAGVCAAVWCLAWGRRWAAVVPLALGLLVAGPAERALAHAGWAWSGRTGALAAWRETRVERLELAGGHPAELYADGRLAATFPDPYGTAARAHLVMVLHPRPERVFVVGGLENGAVVTMLRHPVRRLVAAEEDPGLPKVLPRWFGAPLRDALADPRLEIVTGDPLRAIRRGRWDLVVLADPDPVTLRLDRTRTIEFFRGCAGALEPGGVLVVRVGATDTYLGGGAGRLLAVLASTLRSVFPEVAAIPGEEVLLVAGQGRAAVVLDPAAIEARWRERGVCDPDFDPAVLRLLLDPGRAAPLAAFLRSADAPVNSASHPRAVLLAAALREARGAPPVLTAARTLEGRSPAPLLAVLAAAIAVLVVRGAAGAGMGAEAAAVVGFASMGWWLLLLASWQSTMGSVYGEVGALSAAFMAGTVAGAAAARRWVAPRPAALLWVLAGGAALSLVVATGTPLEYPRAAVVPLLVLGGGLTGAAFPAVAALAGRRSPDRGIGRGFAADEAGAAAAAAVLGLLVVPWAGMAASAAAIAVLEVSAAVALLAAARRGS